MSDLPDEVLAAAARSAVHELQSRYADVVTRRAWPELEGLFLPDAVVHLDTVTRPAFEVRGPGELGRFIAGAVEHFELFEFVVLNRVVDLGDDTVAGGTASGRIFMCELRQHRGTGRFTQAFGRYDDTYRRVDGRWWFAGRRYRSMARTAVPGPPDLEVLWHPDGT